MSRTTTNLGLTAVTNSETIGDFSDAMNASGGNLDIIDGKMGAVGGTSLQAQINTLNSNIVSRSSTIVTIPVGTNAGLFDCGTLATLFNKTGLDQSYIITTFGYIRSGNTTTMDNEVPILVYNNHMYIKVAGTVSNTDISIGVVIQYKMP